MAPECYIAEGKHFSFKTDVWAFGVYIHEVLTGTEPYRGMDLTTIAARVQARMLRPEVPAGTHHVLADIMKRTWAFEPSERPSMHDIFTITHRFFEGGCI